MYSKVTVTRDSNLKLSEHFKAREFRCKDGQAEIFVGEELILVLEDVREHFGQPVIVNSGYRTPGYNTLIGGQTWSTHLMGIAADIQVKGVPPKEVYTYLTEKYTKKYGIGKYETFTHIDTRQQKARW